MNLYRILSGSPERTELADSCWAICIALVWNGFSPNGGLGYQQA
jgi:hypothetical protein